MRDDASGEDSIRRFESLAKRLLSKSKDGLEEVEREGEILADEIIEQPKPMPDE